MRRLGHKPVEYDAEVIATLLGSQRARIVSLVPVWDRRSGLAVARATDTHGSITNVLHIEQADADANFKVVSYEPVVLPSDYISDTVTLYFLALSTAAGGNYVWDIGVREVGAGAFTTLLSIGAKVYAASGTANTISEHSIALTTNPTAGRAIHVEIGMNSNDASDSNTGTRAIYAAWLAY